MIIDIKILPILNRYSCIRTTISDRYIKLHVAGRASKIYYRNGKHMLII